MKNPFEELSDQMHRIETKLNILTELNGRGYYTSDEVAKLFKCSVATIQRRAKAGLIRGAIKDRKTWKFKKSEINKWI